MSNKDLERIKKWLPKGYGKRVQTMTGKSLAVIYNVVGGNAKNELVYNALLKLALENKAEIEKREKLLSTL